MGVYKRQPAAFGVEGLVELGVGHDADLLPRAHQQVVAVGRDEGALAPGVNEHILAARRQPVEQSVALQVERRGGRVVEFDKLQVVVAGCAGLHLADDQRRGRQGLLSRGRDRRFLRDAGRQGEQKNNRYASRVSFGHRFSSVMAGCLRDQIAARPAIMGQIAILGKCAALGALLRGVHQEGCLGGYE